VFDPRYLLLNSKERKQVFEKYVKDRANQESKEKAAALRRKRDSFNDLLREANITLNKSSSMTFVEFSQHPRFVKDDRFKSIEKTKDRESLFNDFLSDLRRIEKEEKYAEKDKLKKAYIGMLKELKHLHRHSSWTETRKMIETDGRFKSLDSSSKREDYFRDYCKYLDEMRPSADVEKVQHHKHHKSEKKNANDEGTDSEAAGVSGDGGAVNLDKSNELSFSEKSGAAATAAEEDLTSKRKEKEKQDRIEASIRERNKEVKKIKDEYNNEREKDRELLRHNEAIESFKALLIDIIKSNLINSEKSEKERDKDREKENTKDKDDKEGGSGSSKRDKSGGELTWKEAKKILKRDARWSYSKVLEKDEKEKLFDEHMDKFRAKKRDLFHQLLDDNQQKISLKMSTWREVKRAIKHDTRYEKLHSSDSFKMEKEFDSYINEKLHKAKLDFRELLLQTKLITYKTHVMIKETPQLLVDIEDMLSKDKTFIVLECVQEDRKKMLLDYIEKLHNEGPPPPPTATEPSRRK
jgi:transcription elongation regulator 1